jgi:hypothetical protein
MKRMEERAKANWGCNVSAQGQPVPASYPGLKAVASFRLKPGLRPRRLHEKKH